MLDKFGNSRKDTFHNRSTQRISCGHIQRLGNNEPKEARDKMGPAHPVNVSSFGISIGGAINKRNQNDVAKIPDYHSEH